MEKKRKTIIVSAFMICIIGISGLLLTMTNPYDADIDGDWQLTLYPTDLTDVSEDLEVVVLIYLDNANVEYVPADAEGILLGVVNMNRVSLYNRYLYQCYSDEPTQQRINMSEMHRWRFRILANNGTIDYENLENNIVNVVINMNQHQNRFLWEVDESSTHLRYGFSYSYGEYTVRFRFLNDVN
jgi:hypothetical protein